MAESAGRRLDHVALGCRYLELSSNDWATWWMEASETTVVMKAEMLASLEADSQRRLQSAGSSRTKQGVGQLPHSYCLDSVASQYIEANEM